MKGLRKQTYNDSDHTILAGETGGCTDCATALRPAIAIISTQGSPFTCMEKYITPLPSETGSQSLACERLISIQNLRAASTLSLYILKQGEEAWMHK